MAYDLNHIIGRHSHRNYENQMMESPIDMEPKSLAESFQRLKCARDLSVAALRVIADVSIRKKIPLGKNLWSMGDPAEFVGILLSGAIEINKINVNGNETCMGIFGPSDAMGISAVIKRAQYPATAKSISKNTEVLKLYLRSVMQEKTHPAYEEISTWLRELLLSHEQILRDKIDILSAGRVESRVIELLTQLSSRFGQKNVSGNQREGKNSFFIPLLISKTQISRLVEVRVETIIRLLSSWSKLGFIEFQKNGIFIPDLEKLRDKADAN